jgi:hypothetical protein
VHLIPIAAFLAGALLSLLLPVSLLLALVAWYFFVVRRVSEPPQPAAPEAPEAGSGSAATVGESARHE